MCKCFIVILEVGDRVIVRMRLTLIFSGRKVRFMCWVAVVFLVKWGFDRGARKCKKSEIKGCSSHFLRDWVHFVVIKRKGWCDNK